MRDPQEIRAEIAAVTKNHNDWIAEKEAERDKVTDRAKGMTQEIAAMKRQKASVLRKLELEYGKAVLASDTAGED